MWGRGNGGIKMKPSIVIAVWRAIEIFLHLTVDRESMEELQDGLIFWQYSILWRQKGQSGNANLNSFPASKIWRKPFQSRAGLPHLTSSLSTTFYENKLLNQWSTVCIGIKEWQWIDLIVHSVKSPTSQLDTVLYVLVLYSVQIQTH